MDKTNIPKKTKQTNIETYYFAKNKDTTPTAPIISFALLLCSYEFLLVKITRDAPTLKFWLMREVSRINFIIDN